MKNLTSEATSLDYPYSARYMWCFILQLENLSLVLKDLVLEAGVVLRHEILGVQLLAILLVQFPHLQKVKGSVVISAILTQVRERHSLVVLPTAANTCNF